MMAQRPSHIARTLAAAKRLGHQLASERMETLSAETVRQGVQFSDVGKRANAICFIGPCDPDTHVRLVAYYDNNGNCNTFVKVPC